MNWSHTFTIYGQPAAWKNSMSSFIHEVKGKGQLCPVAKRAGRCPFGGGRLMAIPTHSPAAKRWMKEAIPQIEAQWMHVPIPKETDLDLHLEIYFKTKRRADCTSIIDAVQDALEQAKVVENDACIEPRGSSRDMDRKVPRIVATISLSRDRKKQQEKDRC